MVGLDRRGFLGASLALAHASGLFAAQPVEPGDRRLVRVREGWLEGIERGGVISLKGVPFAAPPLGPLRFRPPQRPASWYGVREAMRFGRAPLQADPPAGMTSFAQLGAERGEDCLYLNIWAPAAQGPHPVFVWVHGGANESGAASQSLYDGRRFARDGIVCVTVGYRVGIPGFLELGELLGPVYRGSAANGLRDIVAALRWVRDNIAAVGGDPDRVTLGGESAGAKNICSLMAAPQARGLFQSAIVQSGGETVHSPEAARAIARIVGDAIAAAGGKPTDLLVMPPERIMTLQAALKRRYDRPFPFRAVVDGDFLPQAPVAAISAGSAGNLRLLIGTNRDESILFINPAAASRPLGRIELANIELAAAIPIFRRYEAAYPGLSPLARRVRFLTAEEYWLASMRIARGHHRAGGAGQTYVYRFDRPAMAGPFAGWAGHAFELPYVWNALDDPMASRFLGGADKGRRALAAEIHARWVRFIAGGAPDVARAMPWPRFDKNGALLIFDDPVRPGVVDTAELALWDM